MSPRPQGNNVGAAGGRLRAGAPRQGRPTHKCRARGRSGGRGTWPQRVRRKRARAVQQLQTDRPGKAHAPGVHRAAGHVARGSTQPWRAAAEGHAMPLAALRLRAAALPSPIRAGPSFVQKQSGSPAEMSRCPPQECLNVLLLHQLVVILQRRQAEAGREEGGSEGWLRQCKTEMLIALRACFLRPGAAGGGEGFLFTQAACLPAQVVCVHPGSSWSGVAAQRSTSTSPPTAHQPLPPHAGRQEKSAQPGSALGHSRAGPRQRRRQPLAARSFVFPFGH